MARLRYNGLEAAVGASLTPSATAVTFAAALTHSGGTNVPTISGSDYIPLAILDSAGKLSEIVYLTAYAGGATTGTIARGKENTSGVSHSFGDKIVHGPTVSDITDLPAWNTYLNLPLTTLTDWSSTSGTWSASTGQIKQTSTSAPSRLHYSVRTPSVMTVYQVEILPDASIGSGARNAGIRIGDATANAGMAIGRVNYDASGNLETWELLREGLGSNQTVAAPAGSPASAGWHKIRMVLAGPSADMWFMPSGSSTWQFVGGVLGSATIVDRVTLVTEAGGASFRNLQAITILPA